MDRSIDIIVSDSVGAIDAVSPLIDYFEDFSKYLVVLLPEDTAALEEENRVVTEV